VTDWTCWRIEDDVVRPGVCSSWSEYHGIPWILYVLGVMGLIGGNTPVTAYKIPIAIVNIWDKMAML